MIWPLNPIGKVTRVKLLAVETSGEHGFLALVNGGVLIEERPIRAASRRHAQALVPDAAGLLQQHQLAPSDIDVVAVSIGPGSFTGLRVGVVFAKTFAWINQAKLVAVDTMLALAHRVPESEPVVTVVVDAQREELFAASFGGLGADGLRKPLSRTVVVPVDAFRPAGIVSGPALQKFGGRIPVDARVAAANLWLPTAAAVAAVAQRMAANAQWADVESLEPTYIRRSYAEEKLP